LSGQKNTKVDNEIGINKLIPMASNVVKIS